MRWLSQYQGALTTSRLDRAVVARYFAFLVISQLVIFTLIGVGFRELCVSFTYLKLITCTPEAAEDVVKDVGKKSFKDIIKSLRGNVL
jgi:calcium permeable stress-gated cation channel